MKKHILKNANIIITVDNGIKSKEAVNFAKKLGMKVIITDHHLHDDETFPVNADLIISPHIDNKHLEFKDFSGAVVAAGLARYCLNKLDKNINPP